MNTFIIYFIGFIVLFFIIKKIQLSLETKGKNQENKKIESSTVAFKNIDENDNLIKKHRLNEFYKKYENNDSNQFKIQIDSEFTKVRNVTKKKPANNNLTTHKNLTGKKAIKSSYVVIDIETTGLHSGTDEIIEIGAIKIIDSIQHQTFQAFVKPKKTIPYNITELTGITNSMVVNANEINIILKDFIDFIEDYPLVGHNIDFDIKFLNNKMKKANIKFEKKELIDTLPLARKAFTGSENHKLTTLIEYLKINVNDSHRALEDAKATSFVYTTAINILYDVYV